MRRLRRARASAFLVALALLVPVFASPPPVAAETLGIFDIYGSSVQEMGRDVATDAAGNIYVLGDTIGTLPGCDPACTSAGNLDLFIRKYTPDGTVAWTRQLGSAAKEQPHAIAVDGSGNVFAAGTISFSAGAGALPGQAQVGTSSDAFLVKYSTSGDRLWTRQFGLSFASAVDVTDAYGLALDTAGNAYVTGESCDNEYTADVGYVRKYDTSGAVVWEQRFSAINWDVNYDFPMPADVDVNGSVVAVSGATYGTLVSGYTNPSSSGMDAFVATFSTSDGAPGWIKQWGTAATDTASAVAIDSQGRVVITSMLGTSAVASSIRQFDSTGTQLWSGTLATLAGRPSQTFGTDIAIGAADRIAVSGYATGSGALYGAVWLFASDGTAGWSAMPSDLTTYSGIAYGPGGLLYATGDYRTTAYAMNDMLLVRVGPTDTTAPTVSLAQAVGQADPAKVGPVNFSLVADEALDPTTVTSADFDVTNGTIGTIACSGFLATTCTIPVTPTADGPVTIAPSTELFSVADPSSNTQTSVSGTDRSITYDATAPTLTLEKAATQADPANVSPVVFTLVANELVDTATVTAADFEITGGTLGSFGCVGVSATTCTISVNVTADGTVTIAPSTAGTGFSVADLAGNTQTTAGGTDRSITYAASGPVVTISTPKIQGTKVTVKFAVTGATTIECALQTGSSLGSYAPCSTSWTGTLAKGTYTLYIRADGATPETVSFTVKSGKTK